VTFDGTLTARGWRYGSREEQLIPFALVRAFEMIMLNELSDCSTQRAFAEEDELG
jgi:hypothetical protein